MRSPVVRVHSPRLSIFALLAGWIAIVTSVGWVPQADAELVPIHGGEFVVTDGGEGVLAMSPSDGSIRYLWRGGVLRNLSGIAVDSQGRLLVSSYSAFIARLDPATGDQHILTQGGMLALPMGVLVAPDGRILVVDAEAQGTGAVLEVDPETGSQQRLAWWGNFAYPTGLALESNGNILVSDAAAGGSGAIIRVRPDGRQELVTVGDEVREARSIAVEPSGGILVSTPWPGSSDGHSGGQLVRVNPTTGEQQVLTRGGYLFRPGALYVSETDEIYVAAAAFCSGCEGFNGAVVRVDPVTGAQTLVNSLGNLPPVLGVARYPDIPVPASPTTWGRIKASYR